MDELGPAQEGIARLRFASEIYHKLVNGKALMWCTEEMVLQLVAAQVRQALKEIEQEEKHEQHGN